MSQQPISIDATVWEQGMSIDEFVSGMTKYQTQMQRRMGNVKLTVEDHERFARFETPLHVLVTTEDWCGDSLMNLPILARVIAAALQMDAKVFIRSRSPELAARYEGRGITAIPVFTFVDAEFNEISTWVERSEAGHKKLGQWMAAHPEVGELMKNSELSKQERRRLKEMFGSILAEMET